MDLPILRGGRVQLRPLADADSERIIEIRSTEEVAQRWRGDDLDEEFTEDLADDELHQFVIDPAANNEAAIACYAMVGFKPVGVMRSYERSADGSWCDGLLMDMIHADRQSG